MSPKFKNIKMSVFAVGLGVTQLNAAAAATKESIPNSDKGPSYEVAIAGEYFLYNRSSNFLGVGEIGKAASKLKGGLAGVGIRLSPIGADSKNSFEINYREGTLEGSPKYVINSSLSLGSDITDKRTELEVGGQYYLGGSFIKSIRYGYFRMEESFDNVLNNATAATWARNTGGLDPNNAKRYTRKMNSNSAYLGVTSGWSNRFGKANDPEAGIYGVKFDADIQAGELTSNFLSFAAKSSKSALYSLPHKATLYVRSFVGKTSTLFGEVGYRGVYNLSNEGGVKGYDSGAFVKAGFSWSF